MGCEMFNFFRTTPWERVDQTVSNDACDYLASNPAEIWALTAIAPAGYRKNIASMMPNI